MSEALKKRARKHLEAAVQPSLKGRRAVLEDVVSTPAQAVLCVGAVIKAGCTFTSGGGHLRTASWDRHSRYLACAAQYRREYGELADEAALPEAPLSLTFLAACRDAGPPERLEDRLIKGHGKHLVAGRSRPGATTCSHLEPVRRLRTLQTTLTFGPVAATCDRWKGWFRATRRRGTCRSLWPCIPVHDRSRNRASSCALAT